MNLACKPLPPLVALVLGLALHAGTAESGQDTEVPVIRIELDNGLLSAEIRDAPLPQVLAEVGALAGIRILRIGEADSFPRIDVRFDGLPVQTAIERLAANTNSIFFYSHRDGSPRVLSQLWLLGPGTVEADTGNHDDVVDSLRHDAPIIRNQAVLHLVQQQGEQAVLDKLVDLLRSDPDPQLRSRVAASLGSLGDRRAVPALESALRDENASVRAQSMSALGVIGGDRATMALGDVLTDHRIEAAERVLAARALRRQDTELAHGYLQAGGSDADEQVRAASVGTGSATE